MPETHTVYWGEKNDQEAQVRLPPGMAVQPFVEEVSGVSPVHVDGDYLPHPPEWEGQFSRMLTDQFNTYQDGRTDRPDHNEIAVQVVNGAMVVRTIKKRLGKDDVLTIPVRSVVGVYHDRKTFGSDVVRVATHGPEYAWKISDAESFVAELNNSLVEA